MPVTGSEQGDFRKLQKILDFFILFLLHRAVVKEDHFMTYTGELCKLFCDAAVANSTIMYSSTSLTILEGQVGTTWIAETVFKEEHGLWDPIPELTSLTLC